MFMKKEGEKISDKISSIALTILLFFLFFNSWLFSQSPITQEFKQKRDINESKKVITLW